MYVGPGRHAGTPVSGNFEGSGIALVSYGSGADGRLNFAEGFGNSN